MAVAAVVGLALGLVLLRSDASPELTPQALDAARRRWQERGPASYELTLQMSGALNDRRRVEVADGVVVAMEIDGRPAAESAWRYASVDGLLEFLEQELRNAQDPPPSLGVTGPGQVVLRAEFDRELGYPRRFLRHLLGRQQSTSWEIVELRSLD
jgi:hypothetical protein